MEVIRIFLAFTTYMNFKVYQMDVKSAFLNGKIKEEVYVKQPPGFESNEFPDHVCKLDKALYGLKQAPMAWYEILSTFLIQNKFARGRIDNTFFIYKSKGEVILVQVYVDDIIFGSTSYKHCKQFEKPMTKKFEMSMMGELAYFLRLQIKQDDKGISICQEQYTRNLLKKYEISKSSSVKTPMVPPNNLGPDLAGKSVNETSYRGMIGSLMYLTATRPDIQFFTVLCARYQSNPKESHLIAVKRILEYLKGACQILGGKLVCWSAKKQQSVAMSSAEAEYVVAAGCCASILWMKSQLSDYDIHYKMVPIFCDNTSAIAISNNLVLHSRTKHIDIRYHFIRDHILKGDIELHFILIEYQLADIFTKPFPMCKISIQSKGITSNSYEKNPRKKHLSAYQILGGKLVCWSAKKQRSVAMSSAEAEYVVAAGCCTSILWMKSQLSDYDIHYKMVLIFYDNTSAIAISNNPVLYSRTKHIDIIYHFIRDHILKGDIELHFILIEYQLADIFTKPLEFWSTVVAFDPFPSTDEPEKRPLKEFFIKFSVSNGQRPLTLDFKTFCTSTGLDYNNVKYVDHPTLEVLSGNYSSTEQNPSKVTDIKLTAHMIVVNNLRDSVSLPPLVAKSKKGKSRTMAPTLPKSQGPEALGALSRKRKQPKDITSTTSNEGSAKTTSHPEGSLRDKDSRGNIPPANMEPIHTHVADLSGTGAKYQEDQTQSSRLRYQSLTKNKGEPLYKGEPDTQPMLLTYADVRAILLSEDEAQESDEEEQHEEEAVSYADLKASVDQYYDENIAHRDQTDKLVETSMSSLDKSSTTISDLYKGLNVITQLLKEISNAVKDDPATNQKLNEVTETFARISSNITELLSLVKGFDFSALMSTMKSIQDHVIKQEETALKQEISSLRKDTFEIKSMMTEMYAAFRGHPSSAPSGSITPTLALTNIQANVEGENANTTHIEEPPSHTEGETEELRLAIPISSIPSTIIPPT
ncbi:retrovirus-related pol polyprotein from transposon TNT 1-94 [Tanacetum coccineum]